jgi:hypothetical protein
MSDYAKISPVLQAIMGLLRRMGKFRPAAINSPLVKVNFYEEFCNNAVKSVLLQRWQ